jgi:hypothetical protein
MVSSALACALSLALGASACGEEQASAIEVLAAAPDKTLDASTARTTLDIDVSVGGKTNRIEMNGVVDLRTGDGVLHADASQFGVPGFDDELETRVVDGISYVDFGPVFASADDDLPPQLEGKRWMRFDFSDAQEASEALGSDVSSTSNNLQYLRGVSKDGVEEVGQEEVRGEGTTHYRVEIDLRIVKEKLRDADMSDDARAFMEKGLRQFREETMPAEVWVDDDGRVRRQDLEMALRSPAGGIDMDLRMEYFDFGVEVDVEKPPAGEVFDLELLAALDRQEA